MKLFLASTLCNMKERLSSYVWGLQGKKIACCLNPIDMRVEVEWKMPQRAQNDIDMFQAWWSEVVSLDLRLWYKHIDDVLQMVDGIFVSWGYTDYFLWIAKEFDFAWKIKTFLEDKDHFYCSTSAGSCRLWSHIRVYDTEGILQNIIPAQHRFPFMIIPHRWNTNDLRIKKKYLQLEKVYDAGCSVLCLLEEQAIVSNWASYTIVWIDNI